MNEPILHTLVAAPVRQGERLDRVLAAALPHLSRSRISALCAEGAVRIGNRVAKASDKVRSGDRLELMEPRPAPAIPAPEAHPLEILHEDGDLLVVNKPAGMVVHPAPGSGRGTLVNALLHRCPELSGIGGVARPGIVHRLDKETSGCIAIAKNDQAHRALAGQFAGREIEKIYLALGWRAAAFERVEVRGRIGRHPIHRKRMAVVASPRGREALTIVERVVAAKSWSLLRCRLFTGRTHQIRVHLKHIGHPLLGDPLYGGPAPGGRLFEDVGRVMLHAWRLGFVHPRTGARLLFEAPMPDDFLAFFSGRGQPVPAL